MAVQTAPPREESRSNASHSGGRPRKLPINVDAQIIEKGARELLDLAERVPAAEHANDKGERAEGIRDEVTGIRYLLGACVGLLSSQIIPHPDDVEKEMCGGN